MTRRRLYNPAALSENELKASFIARHDMLDELLLLVKDQNIGSPCQHVLLIGTRGMGKTTLGLRFLHAVSTAPELNEKWQPVAFYEESYGISDVSDLWVTALHHLARATDDARWSEKADALVEDERDETRLAAYARAALTDYCQSSKKRLILFVENIDAIFAQIGDEQKIHGLRASLLERSDVMLVGSANTVFGGIRNHREPFYEFFRLFALRELTKEETCQILENFSKSSRMQGPLASFELEQGRLETIRRLTGGNPRLIMLTCGMILESPIGDSFEVLERLVDEQTPYFKARIEELPAQARKVFHCLAGTWKPMLAREVAHLSRLASSHASAQLKQLVAKGYVREVDDPQGKRILYEVADRFYNIYFLIRLSNHGQDRLKRLVGFMHDIFGRNAMRTTHSITLKELESRKFTAKQVADWLIVLSHYVELDEDYEYQENWRRSAVEVARNLILSHYAELDVALDEDYEYQENWRRIAVEVARNLDSSPTDIIAQIKGGSCSKRAHTLYIEKRYAEAATAYRKAIKNEPDDYTLWTGLGQSLLELKRYEELIDSLRHVVERGDTMVSLKERYHAAASSDALAHAYTKLNLRDKAIVTYEKLLRYVREDDPEFMRESAVFSFLRYGTLLSEAGRDEEAISVWGLAQDYFHFDDSAEVRKGAALILWTCAKTLAKLNRQAEAISILRKVPDYVRCEDPVEVREITLFAMEDLRQDLSKWKRTDEVLFCLESVVKYTRAEDPVKLRLIALRSLSDWDLALEADTTGEAFVNLWEKIAGFVQSGDPVKIRHLAAGVYGKMGGDLLEKKWYEKAVSVATKVAAYVDEQDPLKNRRAIAEALAGDGLELNLAEKSSESEAVCRAAIGVAPEVAYPWYILTLAILLSQETERLPEAEECARQAVKLEPNNPDNMHLLSIVLASREQWEEALRWLEQVLRLGLKETKYGERSTLIDSLVSAIVANQGSRVKDMMERVGAADAMEPLWYALRIDLGEKVGALPTEINELVREFLDEFSVRRS